MTAHWKPDFAVDAPAFAALEAAALELQTRDWPTCEDLNRALGRRAARIVNTRGLPLKFVPQMTGPRGFADQYEPRAYLRGEIQFRAGDWHDVFNAFAWITFPKTKAVLNERHFHALERQRASGATNRTPLRDALTLFDESGVFVVTADEELGALLTSHAWKLLFWERRADVVKKMRFYLLGHGLAEKMLAPFVGVTGRGLVLTMPQEFPALPLADQLAELDARAAARVLDMQCPLTAHDLAAVPLLGIPGWCADNEDERYYGNAAYFRPPRSVSFPGRR